MILTDEELKMVKKIINFASDCMPCKIEDVKCLLDIQNKIIRDEKLLNHNPYRKARLEDKILKEK